MTAPALQKYVNGSVLAPVSGDNLNTFEQTCDNTSQLRLLVGTTGMQVFLRGISTPADGGQGDFYWLTSATGPDDNLNTIVPVGVTLGAWVRIPISLAGSNLSLVSAPPIGTVTPNVADGAPSPLPAATAVNPVTVTIGGVPASVAFAGLCPGFAGLYQVNAVVPQGVTTGSAVPVTMSVAGQTSNTVTMAIQ